MSGKYALLIANTEYTDSGLAQLTAPGKDADDFARVLRERDFCAFDDVNVLLNQSSSTINEAIDEFFDQKKQDDLLVLYFSGHGVRDELGALYLAVKNTNRFRLRSTAIKSDFIKEAMDQSRSRRQVLILDCCNSGAFAQGTKAATGVSIGTATAFEGGFGRVILTASDSTQFAWEGDKVIGNTDNSLFTHYLVEGLEGKADRDGDGHITVDELYDYAYEKVRLATPKQTPSKFSTKQQGEIILRQNIRLEDIRSIPLPDELIDATKSSMTYMREAAVKQLEELLKGKNLGLVRSARETLEYIAENDDSKNISRAAFHALESVKGDELRSELNLGKAKISNIQKTAREKINKRVEEPEHLEDKKTEQYTAQRKAKNIPKNLIILTLTILSLGYLIWLGYETSVKQPSETVIFTPTLIASPTLGIGSTAIGEDGMIRIYVPEGEFIMGSGNGDSDEEPVHKVYLDAFLIDQTEVTNKQYRACVDAGKCDPPSSSSSFTHSDYYNNPEFDNFPVVYVSWDKANRYCRVWSGGNLPTEAQWEKTARGTNAQTYPWGNGSANENLLNFNSNIGDTTEVGSYENGISPYKVYDMAGNVWEWVSDWYDETYNQNASSNPLGPISGEYRVLRGGSWNGTASSVRSAGRLYRDPWDDDHYIGFRCAYSP